MRIIAGRFRGRKLKELKADGVRPTLDRVRENLFNIISQDVRDSVFLDLFSGSGAIGFEAMSRGASEVVFSDLSKAVVEHIKSNAKELGESVTVICADYKSTLKRLGKRFDIVYLDPPYDFNETELLYELSKSKILDTKTLVIYEHNSEKPFKNDENRFCVVDERKYGIATLTFLRKIDE